MYAPVVTGPPLIVGVLFLVDPLLRPRRTDLASTARSGPIPASQGRRSTMFG